MIKTNEIEGMILENRPRILIVEDEEKIARLLELELTYENYETVKVHDGAEAFMKFQEESWDLILLDIMIPGLSGIEVLRRVRSKNPNIPVILLTAKDSIEDKVAGLDLGANDYVTKPFQIEELLARIRAALRSNYSVKTDASTTSNVDWHQFVDLKVSEGTREVYRGDDLIELTPREFDLLVYFLKNARIVLNREQLLNAVWGYDYFGDTNVVDVYIRYLRNKMDKPYDNQLIHTVRGVGYVLKEEK